MKPKWNFKLGPKVTTPPEVRFWAKVRKTRGCWNWIAGNNIHKGKYPIFQGIRAHQWVAVNVLGLISDHKLVIDHVCRNKRCVRPDHLRLVTQRTNVLNSDSPAAICQRKQRCTKGHPYKGRHVYIWKGRRYCRTCRLTYLKARQKSQKEKQ